MSIDPNESWDNLHGPSRPDVHWSTDNVGEAAPGVLSPLGAAIWASSGEFATRGSLASIGALTREEALVPARLEDRAVRIFCGRVAVQVEMFTKLGDRLPGTTGQDIAMALLGKVPESIEYRPTKRHYPVIAWKLGRTFLTMPTRLRREPPVFHRQWREAIDRLSSADLAQARAVLRQGLPRFEAALLLQSIAVVGHAQILYEALASLVADAGVGDIAQLSSAGGAEMAVIGDIWRAAQGELTVEQVIAEHGFHGPLEGEVSSVVWREDPRPLERMLNEYANRPDPRLRIAEASAQLPAAQAEVLAALPRGKRPGARLLLNLAAERIPMRGIAKRSFLQGIDVIRASARRIGEGLQRDGLIDDPDDTFYLTYDELFEVPRNARELVARRRERRALYQSLTIPGAWRGMVVPEARPEAPASRPAATVVSGIGVSHGVTEGRARVVTDPSFAEVEPDEILIAPTTDPSWASIMYISSALVVDMGGPISHAAVVARELGLPCVVNTRTGTQTIRTGDLVRVNGDTGEVEILEPVPA